MAHIEVTANPAVNTDARRRNFTPGGVAGYLARWATQPARSSRNIAHRNVAAVPNQCVAESVVSPHA